MLKVTASNCIVETQAFYGRSQCTIARNTILYLCMSETSLSGVYACGACTFLATAPPSHLDFCYCITCQRASGAPFVAWTGIPKASLTWQGPVEKYVASSLASRSFCSKCGSTLAIQYECYPDKTHVALTMVERSDWELPKAGVHIFVKSKPDWYQIPADGLERYKEFDAEFEGKFPDVVETLRAGG